MSDKTPKQKAVESAINQFMELSNKVEKMTPFEKLFMWPVMLSTVFEDLYDKGYDKGTKDSEPKSFVN